MVVERLAAERQRSRVVRVAPIGRAAVLPRVGRREGGHRDQALAIGRGHVECERPAVERRQQEELGDQAVVGDRRLEVDAVREDLARKLVAQQRPAPQEPAVGPGRRPEEEPGKHQPGGIGRAVIAVHVRVLEMALGEVAVQVERAQEALAKAGVRPRAAGVEDAEEPGPAQDAQRGLHRAGPVDGARVRVGGDPALEHVAHSLGVALVAVEEVGLSRRHQPLQPRELPRDLHVAVVARVHVRDGVGRSGRPAHAGLEVAQPVDARSEIHEVGAEQPDAVGEGVLGGAPDPLVVAGAEARVGRRVDAARCAPGTEPRQPLPQRVEVALAALPQQAAAVEAARAPGAEVAVHAGPRLLDEAAHDDSGRLAQRTSHETHEVGRRHPRMITRARSRLVRKMRRPASSG